MTEAYIKEKRGMEWIVTKAGLLNLAFVSNIFPEQGSENGKTIYQIIAYVPEEKERYIVREFDDEIERNKEMDKITSILNAHGRDKSTPKSWTVV